MSLRNYRDLDAWKVAMELVERTYSLTGDFPDEEKYGLKAQMRRAAVSVPSNIAEGQARGTVKFGLHFIRVAIGSVAELDTQLELARRLQFAANEVTREMQERIDRVRQMLYGMRREHAARRGLAAGAVLLVAFSAVRFVA